MHAKIQLLINLPKEEQEQLHLKLEMIKEIFKKSVKISALIEEVVSKGNITIAFINVLPNKSHENEIPMGNGKWTSSKRTITIMANREPIEMAQAILFELCNAANAKLEALTFEQFKDAESYSYETEKAEFETFCRANDLVKDFLQENQIYVVSLLELVGKKGSYDQILNQVLLAEKVTFEDFLKSDPVHVERYKQDWIAWNKVTQEHNQKLKALEDQIRSLQETYNSFRGAPKTITDPQSEVITIGFSGLTATNNTTNNKPTIRDLISRFENMSNNNAGGLNNKH